MANVPADVKIIPGHGPLADLDDLRRFREYLRYSRSEVHKHIALGKDLEAIKAGVENVFPDYKGVGNFTSWAGNLEVIYKEATEK